MGQALLKIQTHLSTEEVERAYKTCKNARIKSRWQLIWLMQKHFLAVKSAAITIGICQRWARQLVHRYNEEGPKGIDDKRKNNTGKKSILDKEKKEKLKNTLLNEKPTDGGLWTSVKVAQWIKNETGKKITSVGAWKNLKSLGFSLQTPRPCHIKAVTEEERIAFKKT